MTQPARTLKHCLVVGANGFLGSELCRQLQARGVTVRALVRRDQDGPWNEKIVKDVATAASQPEGVIDDIDTVFYLASLTHDHAMPEDYQRINVDGLTAFAQAAQAAGVNGFIYISSTKAMAEPLDIIADESFLDLPDHPYGQSKRTAEQYLQRIDAFPHWAAVRPCLMYGPGGGGNLKDMTRFIDRGIFPPLPESGHRRSMISVYDAARSLIYVAEDPTSHRQIYIVTDQQAYSVHEIYLAIREHLGKSKPRFFFPSWVLTTLGKIGDILKVAVGNFPLTSEKLFKLMGPAQFSSEKLSQETGWRPERTFYSELPAIIEDYREHD